MMLFSLARSYLAYGPLLNRAVNVVFEGVPTHPTPARCWEVVDKYQVRTG
jgi:acetyl-CoA synthetase